MTSSSEVPTRGDGSASRRRLNKQATFADEHHPMLSSADGDGDVESARRTTSGSNYGRTSSELGSRPSTFANTPSARKASSTASSKFGLTASIGSDEMRSISGRIPEHRLSLETTNPADGLGSQLKHPLCKRWQAILQHSQPCKIEDLKFPIKEAEPALPKLLLSDEQRRAWQTRAGDRPGARYIDVDIEVHDEDEEDQEGEEDGEQDEEEDVQDSRHPSHQIAESFEDVSMHPEGNSSKRTEAPESTKESSGTQFKKTKSATPGSGQSRSSTKKRSTAGAGGEAGSRGSTKKRLTGDSEAAHHNTGQLQRHESQSLQPTVEPPLQWFVDELRYAFGQPLLAATGYIQSLETWHMTCHGLMDEEECLQPTLSEVCGLFAAISYWARAGLSLLQTESNTVDLRSPDSLSTPSAGAHLSHSPGGPPVSMGYESWRDPMPASRMTATAFRGTMAGHRVTAHGENPMSDADNSRRAAAMQAAVEDWHISKVPLRRPHAQLSADGALGALRTSIVHMQAVGPLLASILQKLIVNPHKIELPLAGQKKGELSESPRATVRRLLDNPPPEVGGGIVGPKAKSISCYQGEVGSMMADRLYMLPPCIEAAVERLRTVVFQADRARHVVAAEHRARSQREVEALQETERFDEVETRTATLDMRSPTPGDDEDDTESVEA
eukprot:gnl/TRDRNA2_/TRDRNA2_187641_c0_seq1.p1 gnl/TRDRNA2_/TRDRNA2_187641_c0~~gnl/TRDRNA2_/TRDRNA2_187641_c0_seq1.p1  ORF type:complete len:669 (-),score=91.77 gnl/TRDRNA2_/TRDRNA2_187641_c0_seq1:70-2076(-)